MTFAVGDVTNSVLLVQSEGENALFLLIVFPLWGGAFTFEQVKALFAFYANKFNSAFWVIKTPLYSWNASSVQKLEVFSAVDTRFSILFKTPWQLDVYTLLIAGVKIQAWGTFFTLAVEVELLACFIYRIGLELTESIFLGVVIVADITFSLWLVSETAFDVGRGVACVGGTFDLARSACRSRWNWIDEQEETNRYGSKIIIVEHFGEVGVQKYCF